MLFGIPLTVRTVMEWITSIENQDMDIEEVFDTDDIDDAGIDKLIANLVEARKVAAEYLNNTNDADARAALISALADLPIRTSAMDKLMEALTSINQEIISHDGNLMRHAISCGVDRTDFFNRYVGYENFTWLSG